MTIKQATINLNNNVVTLHEAFGNVFEFDMNTELLPKWANESLNKLRFKTQIGDCLFFD